MTAYTVSARPAVLSAALHTRVHGDDTVPTAGYRVICMIMYISQRAPRRDLRYDTALADIQKVLRVHFHIMGGRCEER